MRLNRRHDALPLFWLPINHKPFSSLLFTRSTAHTRHMFENGTSNASTLNKLTESNAKWAATECSDLYDLYAQRNEKSFCSQF